MSVRGHDESPEILALAAEAAQVDEQSVRRQLFGVRELISTLVPIALLVIFARNVDWSEVQGSLGRSQPLLVVAALGVYYASFPLRARRWALLLAESGKVRGRQLLALTAGFGLGTPDAIAVAALDRIVSVFSVLVVGGILYAGARSPGGSLARVGP